jgi:hypothetical protein
VGAFVGGDDAAGVEGPGEHHVPQYAIDAMLCAIALAAPGPVTILTSDPEDISALCGRHATVIKI